MKQKTKKSDAKNGKRKSISDKVKKNDKLHNSKEKGEMPNIIIINNPFKCPIKSIISNMKNPYFKGDNDNNLSIDDNRYSYKVVKIVERNVIIQKILNDDIGEIIQKNKLKNNNEFIPPLSNVSNQGKNVKRKPSNEKKKENDDYNIHMPKNAYDKISSKVGNKFTGKKRKRNTSNSRKRNKNKKNKGKGKISKINKKEESIIYIIDDDAEDDKIKEESEKIENNEKSKIENNLDHISSDVTPENTNLLTPNLKEDNTNNKSENIKKEPDRDDNKKGNIKIKSENIKTEPEQDDNEKENNNDDNLPPPKEACKTKIKIKKESSEEKSEKKEKDESFFNSFCLFNKKNITTNDLVYNNINSNNNDCYIINTVCTGETEDAKDCPNLGEKTYNNSKEKENNTIFINNDYRKFLRRSFNALRQEQLIEDKYNKYIECEPNMLVENNGNSCFATTIFKDNKYRFSFLVENCGNNGNKNIIYIP